MTTCLNAVHKYKILKKAVDYSKDIFWIKKSFPEVTLEYISQTVCELSGYAPEIFFNNPTFWINNVVHPEDVEKVVRYYRREKYNSHLEYRIITLEGQVRHVVESLFRVDEYNLIYGVIRDVEEQKEHEQMCVLFENIIDKLPHIVWVYEKVSGDTIYISEEIKQLAGMMPKSFRKDNQKFIDLIHPKDKKRVVGWLHDEKTKNLTGTIKYRIVTRDEKIKWVKNKKYIGCQISNKNIIYGTIEEIPEER